VSYLDLCAGKEAYSNKVFGSTSGIKAAIGLSAFANVLVATYTLSKGRRAASF
jgi:hypothetical protein